MYLKEPAATVLLGGGLTGAAVARADSGALPMQDLRAFAEIFGRIKKDYVEEVDDRELDRLCGRRALLGRSRRSAADDGRVAHDARLRGRGGCPRLRA